MDQKELIQEFLKEFVEGFVLLTVIFAIMDKPLDQKTWLRITKISLLLGGVNTLMAWLDQDSHEKIKQGMKSSVGNTMMAAAFMRR